MREELQVVPLEPVLVPVVHWAATVWISCVTTPNFSNCARWYSNSRRCSSLSYSRSVLAILRWLS